MRAHSLEVITVEPDHGSYGSHLEAFCHVGGSDMFARRVETEDGIGIRGIGGSHLDKSTSARLDRTERVRRYGIMVQGRIALAILLVVQCYSYRIRLAEVG
jgi:hypothetical protein